MNIVIGPTFKNNEKKPLFKSEKDRIELDSLSGENYKQKKAIKMRRR